MSGYTDSPYGPDSSDEPIRHCLRPEELEAIEKAWARKISDPYSPGYSPGNRKPKPLFKKAPVQIQPQAGMPERAGRDS